MALTNKTYTPEEAKKLWEGISGKKAKPVDYNSSFNNDKSNKSKNRDSSRNRDSSSSRKRDSFGKDDTGKYTGRSFNPITGEEAVVGESTIYKPSNSSNKTAFGDSNQTFANKYNEQIAGIARYNGVDMGTAKTMFEANLDNGNGNYKGGGSSGDWSEMVSDYRSLKKLATEDATSKGWSFDGELRSPSDNDGSSGTGGAGGSGVAGTPGIGGVGGVGQLQGAGGALGAGEAFGSYQDLMRETSDGFYTSQKAEIDRMASGQLAELEKMFADAISEGKISVRDAEKDFAAQSKEIEQKAYEQNEELKLHGQNRGIVQSQQMLGLEQGANSRTNTMNNANVSDRDGRINDIKDRITAITQKKDIDARRIGTDRDQNLLSAKGTASQMYASGMADFASKDYFSDKAHSQNKEMSSLGLSNDLTKMLTQQGYTAENISQEQVNKLQYLDSAESIRLTNNLVELAQRNEYDLAKMDKDLDQFLTKTDVEYQYKTKLQRESDRAALGRVLSSRSSGSSTPKKSDYDIARDNEYKMLFDEESDEYKIAEEKQKREEEKEDAAFKKELLRSDVVAVDKFTLEKAMSDPALGLKPGAKPKPKPAFSTPSRSYVIPKPSKETIIWNDTTKELTDAQQRLKDRLDKNK